MNFSEIKTLVSKGKRLYTDARLPEIYCYLAIQTLYSDYHNNRRTSKEIIDALNDVEREFNRANEEYEAYNNAMAHIGNEVSAKLTDGTVIHGRVHSLVFYSPSDYSVQLIAENGCINSVGADMIIYKEDAE